MLSKACLRTLPLLFASLTLACEIDPGLDGPDDMGMDDAGDMGTDEAGDTGMDETGDTGMGDNDCPVANFPPVSADPANADYPDPYLNVYCEGDEVIVEANGIPSYEFVAMTPNALEAQDWEWHFPKQPQVAPSASTIPLLGAAGIAVNGLPIYGPNEAQFPDPYGDPVYNQIVDFCKGHTGGVGDYHYHALLTECLVAGAPADAPSPVIGYSFDGFPIYGPRGCLDEGCEELVEFQSGWVQTGDPTTYAWDNHEYQGGDDPTILDECNGHVGPKGDYHYHATGSFPYILGCYAGTATDNLAGTVPGPGPGGP